jgi:glycosyltransferase involved in cell wall biosynthesis
MASTWAAASPAVLMVVASYLPYTGGTERQLQGLAGALTARGVHVEILTGQRRPEWPLRETMAGVAVHRLPYPKIRWLGTVVFLARAAAFLVTRGRRFQVFHVHTVNLLALVAVVAGRLSRRPVVLKTTGAWELEHGVLRGRAGRGLRQRLMLAVLRHADAWIALSVELGRAIEEAGVPAANVRIIPNGVDTAHFRPPGTADAKQDLRVVFVGRLVPDKALPVLLRAWTDVARRVPAATLDIVGAGPLQPDLATAASQLGLGARVRFAGFHADVRPFLEAATVFVLPSTVEGLSNALLEAMAVGLPAVATRVGGTEDVVIDGGTALMVPPHDHEALAEALTALLTAPERAREMGRQARDRAVERYSLGLVASTYLALYRELIARSCRGSAPSPR